MKNKPEKKLEQKPVTRFHGPDVPNYAILNEGIRAAMRTPLAERKQPRGRKPQSQGNEKPT